MPTSDVTPNGLATASCVQMDDVIIGGDVLIIRSLEQALDGVFLSYCISQNKKQILQLVTGSTVYHLYASDMQKFQIPLPPLPEQTAIAAILTDMDTDITTLETRLAKTKALKTGMCQELLTGKIRLL
jgi:type I restriction enzyme S subunit